MIETNKRPELIKGIVYSNIFAFAAIGLSRLIIHHIYDSGAGVMVFSEFVIIPILMGIICAWNWRSLNIKGRKSGMYSCLNSFIAILLSAIFLKEGVICLVIVSPLIFAFMCLGALIGRRMFEVKNDNLNVSIIALLLVIFIADSVTEHHYENEVSDQIVINAPPNKVWKNVVAFEPIKENPTYWLFNAGLPSPVQSTVTGYYKGAGRKCIFSNGYVFDEVISTYDENTNLVFDITGQPRDPEIMNHLDLIRGQFLLKDNGNGTTTLTGNSWYRLYVFPTWYYDIWAKSIVRNVHIRVMEHIKQLSEQ